MNKTLRFEIANCRVCEQSNTPAELIDPVNYEYRCTVCGTVYDGEDVIDLEVAEDMRKLYVGAKRSGFFRPTNE